MKKAFAAAALFTAILAWGQTTTVNQGAPGNQGPWKVTCNNCSGGSSGGWFPDGGFIGSVSLVTDGGFIGAVAPVNCSASSLNTATSVGVASTATPAATAATRVSVLICNSQENTGSPLLKCRADGVAPVVGVTTPGETMFPGDCVNYNTKTGLLCIANTAATYATAYECVP